MQEGTRLFSLLRLVDRDQKKTFSHGARLRFNFSIYESVVPTKSRLRSGATLTIEQSPVVQYFYLCRFYTCQPQGSFYRIFTVDFNSVGAQSNGDGGPKAGRGTDAPYLTIQAILCIELVVFSRIRNTYNILHIYYAVQSKIVHMIVSI